jgi:hypothetical protein
VDGAFHNFIVMSVDSSKSTYQIKRSFSDFTNFYDKFVADAHSRCILINTAGCLYEYKGERFAMYPLPPKNAPLKAFVKFIEKINNLPAKLNEVMIFNV